MRGARAPAPEPPQSIPMREEEPPLKKIESVDVDVELKSLVSRIKGYASQIKERVRRQKEVSESFINSEQDEEDHYSKLPPLEDDHFSGHPDISLILPEQPSMIKRPKSGNTFARRPEALAAFFATAGAQPPAPADSLILISPRNDSRLEERLLSAQEEDLEGDGSREIVEKVAQALRAKHQAEKDQLQVELSVFKAVVQGMAAKIRYLQDYKLDRE